VDVDPRTLTAVVIAVVGVLAVALAAATLAETVTPESGLAAGGSDSGEGFGSAPPPDDRPVDAFDVPFLQELVLLVGLLAGVAAFGYVLLYWRQALPALVGVVAIAALVWLLSQFLSEPFAFQESAGSANGSLLTDGQGDDTAGLGQAVRPPLFTLLLFGVALLGVLLGFARSSATPSRSTDRSEDADGADPEAAAIGRAAGRAADRIERGDGSNDVYRAWREMTALLDVSNPDATTPREFADAAVDAGMTPEDVRELTRLFEDVRYGGYEPTEERERRAVRVFRRIETEYAPEDA
jgi:hypothetical protein